VEAVDIAVLFCSEHDLVFHFVFLRKTQVLLGEARKPTPGEEWVLGF
jgi:hypothetical protein